MEDYNLIIGSHVSMSSPNYYLGSVREALSYGSNTFMIYTGAPQNIKRTPTEKCKINEGIKLAEENNINLNNIICHAPYLINLGNIKNPNTYKLSLDLLKSEIQRTSDFHIKILVLHPGASLNEDRKKSLDQLINGLNAALNNDNDVKIAIETMAGKGSELCNNFEEVAYVLKNVKFQNKIGVCLDTCHINELLTRDSTTESIFTLSMSGFTRQERWFNPNRAQHSKERFLGRSFLYHISSISVVDTRAITMARIIGPLRSDVRNAAVTPTRPAYH